MVVVVPGAAVLLLVPHLLLLPLQLAMVLPIHNFVMITPGYKPAKVKMVHMTRVVLPTALPVKPGMHAVVHHALLTRLSGLLLHLVQMPIAILRALTAIGLGQTATAAVPA